MKNCTTALSNEITKNEKLQFNVAIHDHTMIILIIWGYLHCLLNRHTNSLNQQRDEDQNCQVVLLSDRYLIIMTYFNFGCCETTRTRVAAIIEQWVKPNTLD